MKNRLLRIAAILLLVAVAGGPAGPQPEKISAIQPDWDTPSQSFDIGFVVRQQFAQQGEYYISTVLTIWDANGVLVDELRGLHPVMPQARGEDGYVEIEPQRLPWDRREETFEGRANVTVEAQLFKRNGRSVQNGDTRVSGEVLISALR